MEEKMRNTMPKNKNGLGIRHTRHLLRSQLAHKHTHTAYIQIYIWLVYIQMWIWCPLNDIQEMAESTSMQRQQKPAERERERQNRMDNEKK